ncbi:hypothetical protein [Lysinibacillus sp. 54212]|uniref:hypothetical protein n=1 Tax=Lysinibacillus sp. 54212 TaxID=3119829 RepID=UPI002FC6EA01
MKDQKKAKWLLGTSGVLLSAVILAQMNDEVESKGVTEQNLFNEPTEEMSQREKELVRLDWTNFEIIGINKPQEEIRTDRKTKRS